MRTSAWLYLLSVMIIAGAIALVAPGMTITQDLSTGLFWSLVLVTTLLRLFRVLDPSHQAYEGSSIGFFAGILVLPLWLFVCLVIITHCIEWLYARLQNQGNHLRAWYIQPFNIGKSIISGACVYLFFLLAPIPMTGAFSLMNLLTVIAAVSTYVFANQVLLGMALYLARNVPFWQSGHLRNSLLIEVPLAFIGFIAVELLDRGPLTALFVFAPILLIYQAFMLPKLQQEAIQTLENFNRDLTAANQAIQQVNDELFYTLAKVFDARDPFVGGHAAQVATYAVAIGQELGLPTARIETLRQSALLHDIGKIAIPEAILHKPSRLTVAEYEFLKKHTDIGADFIETSHGLRHLAPFIRFHHERWDGRGYPVGLAGEAIPLEARILNVCDSVEAMASDRPYSNAKSVDEIIKEVINCAGGQFDPVVAKAFVRIAEREGAQLVINSARAVAAQYNDHDWNSKGANVEKFAKIYGLIAA
ncbi:MAG: HD-GYP domain-containing protein [Caldilineaceae bacterium]